MLSECLPKEEVIKFVSWLKNTEDAAYNIRSTSQTEKEGFNKAVRFTLEPDFKQKEESLLHQNPVGLCISIPKSSSTILTALMFLIRDIWWYDMFWNLCPVQGALAMHKSSCVGYLLAVWYEEYIWKVML